MINKLEYEYIPPQNLQEVIKDFNDCFANPNGKEWSGGTPTAENIRNFIRSVYEYLEVVPKSPTLREQFICPLHKTKGQWDNHSYCFQKLEHTDKGDK